MLSSIMGSMKPNAAGYMRKGSGNYVGMTTGGQEAANYANQLNQQGVSGNYIGNTTGGQEAANYAHQLAGGGVQQDPRWNFVNNAAPGATSGYVGNPSRPKPKPFQPIQEEPTQTIPTNNMGSVGTATIEPLYSAADTAARTAQAAAQFNNDPNSLMKQFSRPGRSNDSGTLSATLPQMSAAGAGMATATEQIPFQDNMANQQFALSQQQQQGNEGINLMNLLSRIQGTNDYQNNSAFNQQLAALMGLLA